MKVISINSGIVGPSGTSGTSGIGTSGTSGVNGTFLGSSGTSGINGTGISGTSGINGTNGTSGFSINSASFATTGSNQFNGDQSISGYVTASSFQGNGRYLSNLPATTNWNYNQEYQVSKTEQLTFSGDYILSGSALFIEGSNEQIEYSPNKYFKKEGKVFIGGNLLVKDSYIENNGQISVGGEVILIGDSVIEGTGTII
jgi:hypothetical protein